MSAFEVYTLAVAGPVLFCLLVVLAICRAAKDSDDLARHALAGRRHLSLVPPSEEEPNPFVQECWDARDLRPLASGVDVQKRTGGASTPRPVTSRP